MAKFYTAQENVMLIYLVKQDWSLSKYSSSHYLFAGNGGMTMRNPYPTLRRDFGDRSWTLELVKEKIGRVIAVRTAHRSPRETVERSEPVAVGHSAAGRAIAGSGSAVRSPEKRWRARSTLLLIVSVGVLFWGAVFWIIFG